MESHHSDLITGLRNLADFLESNDGAEMSRWQRVVLRIYPEDAPEMAVTAKSLGGKWTLSLLLRISHPQAITYKNEME